MIEKDSRFRYISLDPGGNSFGWAVLDVDLENDEAVIIAAGTLKRNKLLNAAHKDLVEKNGEFAVAWNLIAEALYELFSLWGPNAIAYETAHYKKGRISAFKSLVTAAAIINSVAFSYNSDLYVTGYQPNAGKKAVGVKAGSKDKSLVMEAVKRTMKIGWADETLSNSLDEHACDAVAIGIAFYDEHFTNQGK